jgi:hypothetical protein
LAGFSGAVAVPRFLLSHPLQIFKYKREFAEAWQVNLPLTFIRLASTLAPDRLCA